MSGKMMASHLVETVMINVDDFSDHFLTCGTCFSAYDGFERAAKLLPCSHTICRLCLHRILTTETQSEIFRCPICRENIPIPSGGAGSFPPAFIVNQLLDLLATQRRDVVPKCRIHPSQELLFCETCDIVFCNECRGSNHSNQLRSDGSGSGALYSSSEDVSLYNTNNNPMTVVTDSTTNVENASFNNNNNTNIGTSGLNHIVISFNVALKRCSEIMLYKMHLCIQELNTAQQAVSSELNRLSANTELCTEAINLRFAEILALVERRQVELLDSVKRLGDEKRRALTDQLSMIETERDLVRNECNSLKGVMDVRSITKAIAYLNEKLDMIGTLTEPRENAFLRYQDCVDSWFDRQQQQQQQQQQHQHQLLPLVTSSAGDESRVDFTPLATSHSAGSLVGADERSTANESTSLSPGDAVYYCPGEVVTIDPPVAHFCISPVDHSVEAGVVTNHHHHQQQQVVAQSSQSKMSISFEPPCSSRGQTQSVQQQFSILDIARCLAGFGRLVVSTTYPALCTAVLPTEMVAHLQAKVYIKVVDYHGHPQQQTSGTDPIDIVLTDPNGQTVHTFLVYRTNGTYELRFVSIVSGLHKLSVQILNRSIRGSPFSIHVRSAQKRCWAVKEGSDGRGLIQPFAVAFGFSSTPTSETANLFDESPAASPHVYVLDTGNSRLLVLNPNTGLLHTTLVGEALSGQAATGVVWSPQGLWIVNWRAKHLFLLDPNTDQVTKIISSPLFKEPTSITQCPRTHRLFVADNGVGCIFVCDPNTGCVSPFSKATAQFHHPESLVSSVAHLEEDGLGSQQQQQQQQQRALRRHNRQSCLSRSNSHSVKGCRRISGLCVTDEGHLVVSTGSAIRIYESDGTLFNELTLPTYLNNDHPTTGISSKASHRTSLDVNTLCLTTVSEASGSSRSSTIGRFGLTSQSGISSSVRGQFGGVTFGGAVDTDALGKCILASYSDRKRSGVVVWPQKVWNTRKACGCTAGESMLRQLKDSRSFVDSSSSSSSLSLSNLNLNAKAACILQISPNSVYFLDADPGFRRLAGLICVPQSSQRELIVVDQGAQSVYKIRYG